MKRPVHLLLAAVWVLVVVVVSALTWTVIDSAGRGVLAGPGPTDLPAAGTTAEGLTGDPTGDPKRRGEGRPAQGATGGASGTPSVDPSQTSSPGPSAPSGTPPPDPSDTPPADEPPSQDPPEQPSRSPSPSAPPQGEVRTWQGAAGAVTARCVGPDISLVTATPADGWRVQVKDGGPEHVEVEFGSQGEEEHETHIEAGCSAGAPRFDVETDED